MQPQQKDSKSSAGGTKRSVVDRVVGQIRELVVSRGLSIGDSLPTENELAVMFGASRNTVREALRVVRTLGFIETQTKTGTVLSDRSDEAIRELFAFQMTLSPASFRDVQGFRRIIEVGLGDQVLLTATDADFDELDRINRQMLDADTPLAAAEGDFAFHTALISLTRNQTLIETYRLLRPVIHHIMTVGKTQRPAMRATFEAHAEIIAAMRRRDRIAYAYLMSRHMDYALRFFEPGVVYDSQSREQDAAGFSDPDT